MNITGMMDANKPPLTDTELRSIAKELKMPLSEVKEMYSRAVAMGGNMMPVTMKQALKMNDGVRYATNDKLKKALQKKAKKRKQSETNRHIIDTNPSTVKVDEDSELRDMIAQTSTTTTAMERELEAKTDVQYSAIQAINSLLMMPERVARTAIQDMSPERKQQLAEAMQMLLQPEVTTKEYADDPYRDILDFVHQQSDTQQHGSEILSTLKEIQNTLSGQASYDLFTSTELNEGNPFSHQARKEATGRKRVGTVYDSCTSTHLNKDRPQIALKEDNVEQVIRAEEMAGVFDHFTSKELNSAPVDNRRKSGNDFYDNFTSKALNR